MYLSLSLKNLANRVLVLIALCSISAISPRATVAGISPRERNYSIFAYVGEYHNRHIHQIFTGDTKRGGSYVWSVAATRKLYEINSDMDLELELGTAYHTRKQHHWEVNTSLNLRWHRFPWDEYVNTSFAYGLGPSYASNRPTVERRDGTRPAHFLVSMPVELTLAPPERLGSGWESFVRIHHRSGAWGVVSNAKGSNFISGGLRYRF